MPNSSSVGLVELDTVTKQQIATQFHEVATTIITTTVIKLLLLSLLLLLSRRSPAELAATRRIEKYWALGPNVG